MNPLFAEMTEQIKEQTRALQDNNRQSMITKKKLAEEVSEMIYKEIKRKV